MRAIRFHRFGSPEVLRLEEIAAPAPRRGELLIRIGAAGVNPVDAKIRSGSFPLFKPRLPATPGRDIAGTVIAGKAGGFGAGDRVLGMIDYARGAYAEQTLASPRELARWPKGVPLRIAAALPVASLTAWQGLFDHGKLKRGERVLIHGASGGVGHLAVQFAKLCGATVIATASREHHGWLSRLGADQLIDYRSEPFENRAGNVDLVFDLISGETQQRSWQVLKERGGRLVSTKARPSSTEARRHRAKGILMAVQANRRQLERIAALIASGRVYLRLRQALPLRKAREAHCRIERGHVDGKIVLVVQRRSPMVRHSQPLTVSAIPPTRSGGIRAVR